MAVGLQSINNLEWMDRTKTMIFVFGYFRANRFFKYNVGVNGFVDIIFKCIREKQITLGENVTNINIFPNSNVPIDYVTVLSKGLFVAANYNRRRLLSLHLSLYTVYIEHKLFQNAGVIITPCILEPRCFNMSFLELVLCWQLVWTDNAKSVVIFDDILS